MGWSNSSQLLLHYKAEEVDMTTKCRFDCPLCPATLHSAPGRIRTCDARFRKPTLYPLSYGGLDGNSDRDVLSRSAECRCRVPSAECSRLLLGLAIRFALGALASSSRAGSAIREADGKWAVAGVGCRKHDTGRCATDRTSPRRQPVSPARPGEKAGILEKRPPIRRDHRVGRTRRSATGRSACSGHPG